MYEIDAFVVPRDVLHPPGPYTPMRMVKTDLSRRFADLRAAISGPRVYFDRDVAPRARRNVTTVSYLAALAASSAVRPSVFAAFTSTPSSTASLTASSATASRSARPYGIHASPPPMPRAAISAVVASLRV